MRFNKVVLPLPEGPTKETRDPDFIEKDTLFNAVVRISPFRYILDMFLQITMFSIFTLYLKNTPAPITSI